MTLLLICIRSWGIQTLGYLLSTKCGRGATSWLRIASATCLLCWGSGHRPDRALAYSLEQTLLQLCQSKRKSLIFVFWIGNQCWCANWQEIQRSKLLIPSALKQIRLLFWFAHLSVTVVMLHAKQSVTTESWMSYKVLLAFTMHVIIGGVENYR